MLGLRRLFIFFIFFFFLEAPILNAQTFNSFDDFTAFIDTIVAESVPTQAGEELKVTLMQLDAQMKLPSCQSEIHASLSQPGLSAPTNTVLLKCHDANPWEIYVPVHVELMTDMVRAARQIAPGEVLSAEDLLVQKGDKLQRYGDYFDNVNEVIGLISSRLMHEGAVLSKKSVKKALMIQRNQNVNLILKHGLIEITMTGIAKSDGYLNDTIKVMNPSSKKVIDARVVALNSVQVEY